MDYLKFYQLELEPFRNDPDERFYFESADARKAYLRILRGVHQHKGLGVLIGPPGCGKTTLGEHLHRGLDGHLWAPRCLSIGHSGCASGWLLPHVAQAFEVAQPASDAPQLLEQIHARFIELRDEGRHPVLIVDEAQLLGSSEVMEEFRGLLNLMHEGRKTLSIVLLGLCELVDVLALDEPLAQRIEVRVELNALDRDEVGKYLEHRLTVAGGSNPFADDAIDAFWSYSGGVPRLINTLADNALFESFLAEEPQVDAQVVAEAARQLGLEPGSHLAGRADGQARPEWMDSLVPPAETDFGLSPGAVAEPQSELVEEEPEFDDAMNESGTHRKPDSGEFSMGSIVRSLESEEDGEVDLAGALADEEPVGEGGELELEIEDDAGDELEIELAEVSNDPEAESGNETRLSIESPGTEFDLEPDEPETTEVPIPTLDDDGEFDPSSLLECDDEGEIALEIEAEPATSGVVEDFDPASMLDDDPEEPKPATAAVEHEEEDEADLDALFDEIQVPD